MEPAAGEPTPEQRRAAGWAAAGASACLCGTLLTWGTFLGLVPIRGIDTEDGKLVAALAVASALAFASALVFLAYAQRAAGRGAVLAGVVMQGVSALALLIGASDLDGLATLGVGLLLCLAGTGTALWQGVRCLRRPAA